MKMVKVYIDGIEIEIEEGKSVLKACQLAGIDIPTLCYLEGISEIGVCRMCLVEIEGVTGFKTACVYPVSDGMKVKTSTQEIIEARKRVLQLILSDHNRNCLACVRNLNCELQNLADNLGVRNIITGERNERGIQCENPAIVREFDKCIVCRRCEAICSKVIGANVYSAQYRGLETLIAPPFCKDLNDVACIMCGQCVIACPTASLHEKEAIEDVWQALRDPDKTVIIQNAPSVQVTIGEIFGMPIGSIVTGKLIAAERMLGFNKVFPTDFSADLTIMEEGHEFLERMKKGERLPLLTSCCPGWVKFCEHFYPELTEKLSTCKSPHEMFGSLTKHYFAKKNNLEPSNIVVVAVMPCTAKKYEAARPEMFVDGVPNVDYVLTVRELGRMIRQAGLDFKNLKEQDYDNPFGEFSGAGAIFGATGGVMEAAIRTIYAELSGDEMLVPDFSEIRGQSSGVKEGYVNIGPYKDVKIAVIQGTGNARPILEKIKNGEGDYKYIEIMACPGGCVGGGGQPIIAERDKMVKSLDYRHNRADSLYNIDSSKEIRRSHENPAVKKIYEEFLEAPLSPIAEKLLHTSYTKRSKYPKL